MDLNLQQRTNVAREHHHRLLSQPLIRVCLYDTNAESFMVNNDCVSRRAQRSDVRVKTIVLLNLVEQLKLEPSTSRLSVSMSCPGRFWGKT